MMLSIILSSCTPKLNGEGLVSLITTSNALRFSPENKVMTAGNQFQVTVAGGTEPYLVTIYSGRGTLDPTTLIYQAEADVIRADPGDQGEVVILQAVDAKGKSVTSKITIVETLEITTPAVTVGAGMTHAFSATGGVPAYAYSISSGAGSINNATGLFTASSSPGTVFVRVRDSEGNEAFAFVTVVAGFGGSTEDEDLPVSNTFFMAPAGGQSPYSFQFVGTPAGTITASSGNYSAYVAPSTVPGTNPVQVEVTDSLGQQMTYRFNIVPAVQISPTVKYVEQGDTFNFAASDGIGPYVFSDDTPSSSGSIDEAGLFTATTTAGSMTVKVTDAYGNTSTAIVHVYPPLQVAPSTIDWQIGTPAIALTASGGDQSTSYSWTRTSGSGTPASGSGTTFNYTPASVHGSTETVRVSDVSGNTSTATIRVYSAFMLTPASVTMQVGNTFTIAPSGGIPPYNFVLNAGTAGGDISVTSGSSTVYTASGTSGTESVTITDSIGNNDTFNITVQPALAMTNTGTTVAVENIVTFTPTANTGGTTPLNFSATCGDVNAAGVFEAPLTVPGGGTCTVTLSDSFTPPNTVDEVVTINPALSLVIDDDTIDLQQTATLTASGGVPPYTISQTMGDVLGTFTFGGGSTATFEADNTPGNLAFQVTDSMSSTPFGTVNATINMPTPITHPAGSSFTLSSGDIQALDPAGGVPSYDPGSDYTFTVNSGSAYLSLSGCTGSATTCTGQTATVTAATVATQQVATVQLSDGVSSVETLTFTINPDVQIDPTTLTLTTVDNFTFSTLANTGVPNFIYSILSGGGSITLGNFVASGATPGTTTTIQVRDRNDTGDTSSAIATIRKPLQLNTATSITLNTINEDTQTFTVDPDSGVPPFTLSGSGSGGTLTAAGAGVTTTDLHVNAAGGTMSVTVTDSWTPTPHSYTTNVTLEVPAPTSAPTFPAGAVTSVTSTNAVASWNQVNMSNSWGSSPLSDYQWSVDGGSWTDVSATTDTISGATFGNGSTHTLSVRAVSSGGSGPSGSQNFCDLDYYLNPTTCTQVDIGEFSPGGTVSSATGCSNGQGTHTYTSRGNGANACTYSCNPGYGTASCTICAASTYDAVAGGQEACASCAVGQWSSTGSSSCSACNATVGKYWSTAGTSATTCESNCTTGLGSFTYTTHGGTTDSCDYACNSGFGTSSCTACASGTYDSVVGGQEACANCGPGSSTGGTATSCTACGAGEYSSGAANASCSTCTNKPGGSAGSGATSISYTSGNTSSTCNFAAYTCPANSTWNGSLTGSGAQCNCNSGYTWSGGSCQPLITCYTDSDGDGNGAGAPVQKPGPTCPAGFSSLNTDCCDGNSLVHPGAPWNFSGIAISGCSGSGPGANGSFDYDCDSTFETTANGNLIEMNGTVISTGSSYKIGATCHGGAGGAHYLMQFNIATGADCGRNVYQALEPGGGSAETCGDTTCTSFCDPVDTVYMITSQVRNGLGCK